MSIRTNITTILVNDLVEMEEVAGRLERNLDHYTVNHPDFSAVIEKHIDTNQIVVKVMYLEESVN